ncbi:MAG TPA: 2-oxoacid:acceptor oxidoreductase family protein [Acidimicrobiales bacterium]|nr:2-oxoacid:acceptor oxidoreductase family protein [Acidimicrobiales bacterium]
MFEVRIHGRGGQGVVTAAELLAVAAFEEGRFAQAFPSFGSERTGAPVVSYCRLDERQIRTREPVVAPDALIVLDPTLVHQVDLFSGLSPEGFVLVNTTRTFDALGLGSLLDRFREDRLVTVPASEMAQRHTGRPVPNAVLLGGFAAVTAEVSLSAVVTAVRDRFGSEPSVAEGNVAAAAAAYAYVRQQMRGVPGEAMLSAPPD